MSATIPLASPALGAGVFCLGLGASRRIDTGWKALSLALFAYACTASPAFADQFVEAADNAKIDCVLSRSELTRIALVGDGFANVSKIASAYPYSDFTITNEPVRGDIYISVPPQFASDKVSFFATSKAGFVYKFACRTAAQEASQVFITNPALKAREAEAWERETGPDDAAVRLIEAMATDGVLPGFSRRAELGLLRKTGSLEVQLVAEYIGAELTGQRFRLRNLGKGPLELGKDREGPAGVLAFAYGRDVLLPGEITSAFLVFRKGGLE
ncbi:type-F conjugative transfer system secretin TraK [Novosphingobium sp.]|uniref:type-F conjugative transfer system secretin TraK n=1 Tax=Novosphingobium sp. TaxID=1874826 RepID=UPI0026201EFC|nr:type-F conjugative transfer system secretin TraK [Novosphingobium sp.]